MKTVVLKFGGTSVGSIDRIKNVAKIISSYKKKKMGVIVVSSAMSGTTNELIKKTKELSNSFDAAEYDVLLATFLILSIFPTEVPPNFKTTVFIDIYN